MTIFINGIEYRLINGYDTYYVSKNGEVYSAKTSRFLKHNTNWVYNKVELCKNGKAKSQTIHKLVANAFIKNPFNKPCINHINGNKRDNNSMNLEWVTYKENSVHALKNHLLQYGSKHHKSKLNEESVRLIRFLKGKLSHNDIAYCFDISRPRITEILLNNAWKVY